MEWLQYKCNNPNCGDKKWTRKMGKAIEFNNVFCPSCGTDMEYIPPIEYDIEVTCPECQKKANKHLFAQNTITYCHSCFCEIEIVNGQQAEVKEDKVSQQNIVAELQVKLNQELLRRSGIQG